MPLLKGVVDSTDIITYQYSQKQHPLKQCSFACHTSNEHKLANIELYSIIIMGPSTGSHFIMDIDSARETFVFP